jgi:ribosomal protein S18 acetylase RimI-like enzyme
MIRRATEQDLPALQALWIEFLDFHRARDPYFTRSPQGQELFAQLVLDHLDSDRTRIVVATDRDTVIGYGIARMEEGPKVYQGDRYGYIEDVVVAARQRRRGIGTALYQALAAWLRGQGIKRIELDISTQNEVATAFWRAQGFQVFMQRFAKVLGARRTRRSEKVRPDKRGTATTGLFAGETGESWVGQPSPRSTTMPITYTKSAAGVNWPQLREDLEKDHFHNGLCLV